MIQLIIFILSTAGLTWIIVKSKLLVGLRVRVSKRYDVLKIKDFHEKKHRVKTKIYWFFDSIFNCVGCFGFWSAGICYTLILNEYTIVVNYMLSGCIIGLILNKII